jgi:2-keto-myo-inositol isomerase
MSPARLRLALHTWTLDSTPLADALGAAREAGWEAVELRRVDFTRAAEAGQSATAVMDVVRASGLPVACVGVELGWMWATGAERKRLFSVFAEQCERAAALGSPRVMSPVNKGRGDLREAVQSLREVGDIAARHGVKLALEFNSQAEQLNTLAKARELLALAGHPHCGLLLDAYHLQRSGGAPRDLDELGAGEIFYVQYSDVPRGGLEPGKFTDRLPPGRGCVPFREFFARLAAAGYAGDVSYEAPNPEAWKRPPGEVAREAFEASRAVLPSEYGAR